MLERQATSMAGARPALSPTGEPTPPNVLNRGRDPAPSDAPPEIDPLYQLRAGR